MENKKILLDSYLKTFSFSFVSFVRIIPVMQTKRKFLFAYTQALCELFGNRKVRKNKMALKKIYTCDFCKKEINEIDVLTLRVDNLVKILHIKIICETCHNKYFRLKR